MTSLPMFFPAQETDISDVTDSLSFQHFLFPIEKCLSQPSFALVHRDATPTLHQSNILTNKCSLKLVGSVSRTIYSNLAPV